MHDQSSSILLIFNLVRTVVGNPFQRIMNVGNMNHTITKGFWWFFNNRSNEHWIITHSRPSHLLTFSQTHEIFLSISHCLFSSVQLIFPRLYILQVFFLTLFNSRNFVFVVFFHRFCFLYFDLNMPRILKNKCILLNVYVSS